MTRVEYQEQMNALMDYNKDKEDYDKKRPSKKLIDKFISILTNDPNWESCGTDSAEYRCWANAAGYPHMDGEDVMDRLRLWETQELYEQKEHEHKVGEKIKVYNNDFFEGVIEEPESIITKIRDNLSMEVQLGSDNSIKCLVDYEYCEGWVIVKDLSE